MTFWKRYNDSNGEQANGGGGEGLGDSVTTQEQHKGISEVMALFCILFVVGVYTSVHTC